jgi:hypothetical protein
MNYTCLYSSTNGTNHLAKDSYTSLYQPTLSKIHPVEDNFFFTFLVSSNPLLPLFYMSFIFSFFFFLFQRLISSPVHLFSIEKISKSNKSAKKRIRCRPVLSNECSVFFVVVFRCSALKHTGILVCTCQIVYHL